jgi:hypothetical protein
MSVKSSPAYRFCLAGIWILAGSCVALGGDYSDPSGFSFEYPEGWYPVTQQSLQEAKKSFPPELKQWLAQNRIDLSHISVMVVRNAGDQEFHENLNVVVDKQQIPVDENSLKKLSDLFTKQYSSAGVKIEDLSSRFHQIGARKAMVFELVAKYPGQDSPVRQRQFVLPGGGKTYFITFTAPAERFERTWPTFESVLYTFQAPEPVPTGFDFGRILNKAVVGAIVGMVIGGLVAVWRLIGGQTGRFRSVPG